MTVLLLIVVASVAGLAWWLARQRVEPQASAYWLAPALRAIADAEDAAAIRAVLSGEVAAAVDASHVEWWQRDAAGAYVSRFGSVDAATAPALEAWVVAGEPWRSDGAPGASSDEALRELLATGARLVVPIRRGERALGLLAVGGRSTGRGYDDRDVGDLEVLAHHLALRAEREESAAQLAEAHRMLQQATRLSTVGTLAAELAHEIRNPLVAVQTFLQILPERLDDPEVTVELRGVALTELQRVARLLNELLGMARASVATFTATDLELVVEQVVRILQVSARKKEVVLERRGDALPVGAADASRLKQALVNLVLNAVQASPAGTTVFVETRAIADADGAPAVEIVVRDQGSGIPADVRDRIFHPFFTTKEHGTGLGLPVTRQIVADHGGSIDVANGPDGGAVFIVRMPLVLPAAERRDRAA